MILNVLASVLLVPMGSDPADSRVAIYDLSAVTATMGGTGSAQEWLLPVFRPRIPGTEEEGFAEIDEERLETELLELIVSLYPDEFEFEGRTVELLADGRLALRGPESLHARVGRLLEFLEEVVNAEVEISVDMARLPARAQLPERAVLPEAEAERWLAGIPTANRQRFALRLRADRVSDLDARGERPIVLSYMTEIAESSFIHDPLVVYASFGTRVIASAVPGNGGLELALTLQRGHLAGPVIDRELGLEGSVSNESGGMSYEDSPGIVQTFELLNRSLSMGAFLPDGQALLFSTFADGGRRDVREVVVVRRTGGELPAVASLSLDPDPGRLTALNTGALAPPGPVARGRVLDRRELVGLQLEWNLRIWEMIPLLSAGFRGIVADTALEAFAPPDVAVLQHGPWAFLVDRGAGSTAPDIFDVFATRRGNVEITVALERANGNRIAAARVPMRPGHSGSIVLGVEELHFPDYMVEIAQKSASPTPLPMTSFDGLVLWMHPRTTPSGNLVLEVRGGGHVLTSEATLDINGPLIDFLDQPAFDQLLVDERLTFQAEGERSVVLGAADRGTGDELRLVIEATW